ncbi:MAG: hypothetical protein LBV09_00200 [Deferribacteraceae bacterium]|jgi:glycosyltransferase involved in cell wall biosynthesis|nr:hypothetical protein [Deferribacteraceae bacterium]
MKKKLLFDASILTAIRQKDSSRSGILWVAYNVIKELLRQDKFDLHLYCAPERMRELLFGLSGELRFLKDLPIINIEPQKAIKTSASIDISDYQTLLTEYTCEPWGVWTSKRAICTLLFDVAEIKDLEIIIDLDMAYKSVKSYSITDEAGNIYAKCPSGQRMVSFKIPLKDIKNNKVIFYLDAEGAASPMETEGATDPRVLGLGVKAITVIINEEYPKRAEAIEVIEPKKATVMERYVALRDRKNSAKRDKKYIALFFRLSLMVLYKIYFRFHKEPTAVVATKDNPIYTNYLKECELFLSPMYRVPAEIAKIDSIHKYTILYDLIPLIFEEYSKQPANKWIQELADSINPTDYYFSISKHTRKDFIHLVPKINPDHVSVIPLSTGLSYAPIKKQADIDAVKKKYKIPANKKYALSLCTLEPRKNLVFAAKNFIKFIDENKVNDRLFVLGGGHWAGFIAQLEQALDGVKNAEKYIKHIGYVDDEAMTPLYSGAEFFRYMSLYEGCGMPL